MCGIWAVFGCDCDVFTQFNAAFKISHRGPDAFRLESINQFPSCCLGFYRLAILDPEQGMQPMRVSKYPHIWLIYNGEIYNHKNLGNQFNFDYVSQCDGESIIHLYAKGGIEFAAKHLDGVFAFCLLDTVNRRVYLGRDTFGVKPLFHVVTAAGSLSVCSEVKGLVDMIGHQDKIQEVLPGHVETYSLDMQCRASLKQTTTFHQIGDFPCYAATFSPLENEIKVNIRTFLRSAVDKRMMSDRRIGCLLSGGVDSSLLTALLVELAKERKLPYPIQTFSVGMENSPDLAAARKVSKHLGTEHHEILLTPMEAISVIEDVIYFLESYDVITIRGSAAMYLLCKYVKEKTDSTVLLSGEGADEVAQGYIYLHNAPSVEEGDKESRRLCKDIHMFDVQRVDRMSSAFGLEIRVPYLDHTFTSYYLSLDPEIRAPKNGMEKQLMRSTFEDTDLIPNEILWRHKEGFSDGLTTLKKSWYEIIHDFLDENIDDSELIESVCQYPFNTPVTKEALYYRRIFEKFYPGQDHLTPHQWTAKWSLSTDPSGRTLSHYKQ
ncbi:asparagine synthetase [glutamine-hydrolyzing]-like [Ylistrum balloti]|uniref:asparagine synthetase [glutamine-hydrolyzing]-like n=1 Tax=Ylistrum balloti TaxID=509963 RepID=UPI002905D8DF|nr:asparagine synthetase [glutamine-hydrolyzing]-like [Ylistrum balloti]